MSESGPPHKQLKPPWPGLAWPQTGNTQTNSLQPGASSYYNNLKFLAKRESSNVIDINNNNFINEMSSDY